MQSAVELTYSLRMTTRMRAWMARKNGVGTGDNDPLLDLPNAATTTNNNNNTNNNTTNTTTDANANDEITITTTAAAAPTSQENKYNELNDSDPNSPDSASHLNPHASIPNDHSQTNVSNPNINTTHTTNDTDEEAEELTPAERRALHRKRIRDAKKQQQQQQQQATQIQSKAKEKHKHKHKQVTHKQAKTETRANLSLRTIRSSEMLLIGGTAMQSASTRRRHYSEYGGLPEDAFIYVLMFLNESDKCWCAQVSLQWRNIVYQPILWQMLDLSRHYARGAHDYLLKHILTKCMMRFSELVYINLENCIALTDRSLIFITEHCCNNLKVLLLTNCYKLNPKTILECVRKLPFLLKLELFGVISDKNKYYFQQQLQQLTYFINEIASTRAISNNGSNRNANNDNNNNNPNRNRNIRRRNFGPIARNNQLNVGLMEAVANNNNQNNNNNINNPNNANNANNNNNANENDNDNNNNNNEIAIGNRDDNEDNARRGAAAPLEAEGDNRRRLERIQRIEIMGLLAQSIKQTRPWIDLGLFWLQLLSIVGMNDPCMILDRDSYHSLYPSIEDENESNNELPFEYIQYRYRIGGKYPFYGARVATIPEWILYSMKKEILERNENNNSNINNINVNINQSNNANDNNEVNSNDLLEMDEKKDDLDENMIVEIENNNNNSNGYQMLSTQSASNSNDGVGGAAAAAQNEDHRNVSISISMQSPKNNINDSPSQSLRSRMRKKHGKLYEQIDETSDDLIDSNSNNNANNNNNSNKTQANNTNSNYLDAFEPKFELAADHEWMQQSTAMMARMKKREKRSKPGLFGDGDYIPFDSNLDTFGQNNNSQSLDSDSDSNNSSNSGIVGISTKKSKKHSKASSEQNTYDFEADYDLFHETNADNNSINNNNNNQNLSEMDLKQELDREDRFAMKPLNIELIQQYFKDKYHRLLPPPLIAANCRYQGRFQGGCWGRVKGRLVYSNQYYSQGGNFPNEILFSCEAHSNEDLVDERFHLCRLCEKIFRFESMFDEMYCKVCHDTALLQEKSNWIQLNKKKSINKQFHFAHVCSNTLNIADRRNLPTTLKSFGKVEASLSYNVIFEQHAARMDNNNNNNNELDDLDANGVNNNNEMELAGNEDLLAAQERQRQRQRQRERERIEQLRRRHRYSRQQQRLRRRRNDNNSNNNNNNNGNENNRNEENIGNENNNNDDNNNNEEKEEKLDELPMNDEFFDSDNSDDSDLINSSIENDNINVNNNNNNNENNNNNNENEINPNEVAIIDFWQSNSTRVSTIVDKLQKKLKKAAKKDKTRAILVYSDNNPKKIEVLADDGVIFDGPEGDDYMFLTISAWTQFYNILLPVLICVLATIIFIYELDYYNTLVEYSDSSSSSRFVFVYCFVTVIFHLISFCFVFKIKKRL